MHDPQSLPGLVGHPSGVAEDHHWYKNLILIDVFEIIALLCAILCLQYFL